MPLSCFRGAGAIAFRIQHHLLRVLQIDGVDAAIAGLPLRKIFNHHAVLAGEISGPKVDGERLRIIGASNAGHYRAQILWVGEVHFADAVGGSGTDQFDVGHKLLVGLHPLTPFLARHALGQAGYNWKLQIFAAGAVENHAMRVDESKFRAIAQKCNRRSLDQIDADAIGKNALHGGGFDPGDFFQSASPSIQRNAQHATSAVAHKLLQHRIAAHDMVAVDLNLFWLDQQHLLSVKQKPAGRPRRGHTGDSYDPVKQNAPVEGPGPAAEFLAADFDRLLATQIARLIVTGKFRPIRVGVRRGAPRYGLQPFQITTSSSSSRSKADCTLSRTLEISASMSLAPALPAFTKKLAWRSLTRASPMLRPFRPRSSIMRPAEAPGGFLKMQPALFWPSGWLERRFSLQIRIPWRISLNGLEGSSSFTASIISSAAKEV